MVVFLLAWAQMLLRQLAVPVLARVNKVRGQQRLLINHDLSAAGIRFDGVVCAESNGLCTYFFGGVHIVGSCDDRFSRFC